MMVRDYFSNNKVLAITPSQLRLINNTFPEYPSDKEELTYVFTYLDIRTYAQYFAIALVVQLTILPHECARIKNIFNHVVSIG